MVRYNKGTIIRQNDEACITFMRVELLDLGRFFYAGKSHDEA